MTLEEVREIVSDYDTELKNAGVETLRSGDSLSHARWMCSEIIKMIEDDKEAEKIMRWLGFVQGVLFMNKTYSIDEMIVHNTSKPALTEGKLKTNLKTPSVNAKPISPPPAPLAEDDLRPEYDLTKLRRVKKK